MYVPQNGGCVEHSEAKGSRGGGEGVWTPPGRGSLVLSCALHSRAVPELCVELGLSCIHSLLTCPWEKSSQGRQEQRDLISSTAAGVGGGNWDARKEDNESRASCWHHAGDKSNLGITEFQTGLVEKAHPVPPP